MIIIRNSHKVLVLVEAPRLLCSTPIDRNPSKGKPNPIMIPKGRKMQVPAFEASS